MKLLRFGPVGAEKAGILDGQGRLRDLSSVVADITPAVLSPASLDSLRRVAVDSLPLVPGAPRLGVPVSGIGNIVAIGLNYRDHAAESNMRLPSEPIAFTKHGGAINGPFDPVVLPPGATKADWEVELGVVIGRTAWQVSEAEALDHVAGYVICNDVSERAFQLERGGQWIKGKSAPTFAPIGPWLVTADEVPDPQSLRLWLDLNGQRMQDGSTSEMIFGVAVLISYLSRFMALQPGDLVSTGTPAGVGMGRGMWLKRGDVMTLGVAGLGEQRQEVR
jgi:2-keto-4-pentenoate hydratase/2-oxohepta-3-ene-1,7-dioic acid hydratase in catechol pathway